MALPLRQGEWREATRGSANTHFTYRPLRPFRPPPRSARLSLFISPEGPRSGEELYNVGFGYQSMKRRILHALLCVYHFVFPTQRDYRRREKAEQNEQNVFIF